MGNFGSFFRSTKHLRKAAETNSTDDEPTWHLLVSFDTALTSEILVITYIASMFVLMLMANSKPIRSFTQQYLPRLAF
jgi:hypothetical protein